MKMRAFYGSRFSKNMTRTPEGFLICHNVPIARTGWYEYLGDEIGDYDQAGKVVKVFRSPEEVFSDGAMASFEGKPVTDEHPSELVTPENATRYAKGAVQNVRQGTGEETDLLLADLVVYDQTLINEVQAGKREVSCGYDVEYVDNGDGTYSQKQISGNHVAVVSSGRAGNRVAIKDSKENPNMEGATKMAKTKLPMKQSRITDFLAAIGLKQFAMDADPEEIKYAMDAMAEERAEDDDDQVEETKSDAKDDDQDVSAINALKAQLDNLTALVQKLAQGGQAQDEDPEKAIDDAISELQKGAQDDDEEESHTVPADTMDDEGPVSDPEDRPKDPLPGYDNAYKIQALKAIKPILAAIPDKAERKKAADAAIASIKGKPSKNTYGQMAKRPKKPAAVDNQPKAVDHSQLGKEIAKKFNPHYKERA